MPGYKVTDSKEMSTMTRTGDERKHYRVWIQTDLGATGSVNVPISDWNEEILPVILQQKADELDLAFNLTS